MEKVELQNYINIILSKSDNLRHFSNIIKRKYDLVSEIKFHTEFLPSNSELTQRIYHILSDAEVGKCLCGVPSKFINIKYGYKKYCKKCRYQSEDTKLKRKQTNLATYGVDHPSKSEDIKFKKTNTFLSNYGETYYFKTDTFKEQAKLTNLVKYGVEYASQSEEFKNQFKQTCIDKYGVENPSKNEDIKIKRNITFSNNWGMHPLKNKEVRDKIKQSKVSNYIDILFSSGRIGNIVKPLFRKEDYKGTKKIKYAFECVVCHNIFEDYLHNGNIPRCTVCYPKNSNGTSDIETEICKYLISLDLQILHNSKSIIPPYELDIYLPDYKLAIEFDGLYYHSEINGGKDKNYHINKTKLCNEKGIQLIHIFEDEWIDKQEIVKSIIKNKLDIIDTKIYARKCEIKKVSDVDSFGFLFNNHLQEPIYSKYNYGLYYNNELVQLVCLSKPRFNKKYQYELIRSCSKINTQIIGGFDRLIKYAVNKLNITSLISYVDKRYFNGSGYKNNWKNICYSEPSYFYIDYHKVIKESRIKYQKHKLKKLFPEHYSEDLTEWQIMQLAGYDRIWDCGNLVFEHSPK